MAALQQELDYKQTQLKDLHTQIEQNTNAVNRSISANYKTGTQNLAATEKSLHDFLHTKEAEEKRLNEADTAYYNHRNVLQEKESELRHKIKKS